MVTGDPEEALRLMAAENPQLALLDLMLLGADGIELMPGSLGIADVPVIYFRGCGRILADFWDIKTAISYSNQVENGRGSGRFTM